MKKINKSIVITSFFAILFITQSFGQEGTTKYRRSSLSTILIESPSLGKSRDMVVNAYNANPFPDKYNKHNSGAGAFNLDEMEVTTEDFLASGFYQDTLRKTMEMLKASLNPLRELRYLSADSSSAIQEPSKKQTRQIYLDKYIRENNLAKSMAGVWFNRTDDGTMNWDLVKERGMYSASAEDKDQASDAALGEDLLLDFELLGNTYSVFNEMEFYENEPWVRIIRDEAKIALAEQGLTGILYEKAAAKIDQVYEKTKVGYTVKCNSFLYKLDWDENIANTVNKYFFNDEQEIDKIQLWDTTSVFNLSFVGKITSGSIVTFKIGETRTEEEIIDLQIRRTMDNALAKLQKKYVQFRPVSPISSVEPLTARIGMKEGLEGGEKFEILEMGWNDIGIPEWKSVGKLSLDKKAQVWDNRQGAEVVLAEDGSSLPEFTTFKGGKKAMPGMHYIRLVK
tara:strand:+ start:961 stop:2319 length:1359 start_codon:yes stop_codon:yes gene_type:complete